MLTSEIDGVNAVALKAGGLELKSVTEIVKVTVLDGERNKINNDYKAHSHCK